MHFVESRRKWQRVLRVVAGTALVAVAVAGCTHGGNSDFSPRPHPTDAQARQFLSQILDIARTKDFKALCWHGTAQCADNVVSLDAAATIPTTAPLVVGSRDVADANDNGTFYQGGRLLEVCGLDGEGTPYKANVLFFGTDANFLAFEPYFWTGMSFTESRVVGPTPTAGPEYAVCPTGE
jgi:hypothetical protein